MKIYTLPSALPQSGSVLGGVLELRGNHISVACFHGINFKSKSWALFSLRDPSISFVSDAQEIFEDAQGAKLISIFQKLSICQPFMYLHTYNQLYINQNIAKL